MSKWDSVHEHYRAQALKEAQEQAVKLDNMIFHEISEFRTTGIKESVWVLRVLGGWLYKWSGQLIFVPETETVNISLENVHDTPHKIETL